MPRLVLVLGLTLLPTATFLAGADPQKESPADRITVEESDWPWWRGPKRNGVAGKQKPPMKWSESENVLWKSAVPGRGHGSPTVVGEQVFLATATTMLEKSKSVLWLRSKNR